MNRQVREVTHGFQLNHKETIAELKADALLFGHVATGAELLILECEDDNKVFSATFRTPPGNDRGVAHILEHSVLCGSEKFPVKEPFVELMKGSLQTFLNAMTFPDKTMYPVASRNAKDFRNLMDVYLDAVFFPRITEETFMQEGWHYELLDLKADLEYKGVVYNEMKGVFSSPENLLDRCLAHSLFPKTAYGFESGGDPQAIPDLTCEEFKEFHRRHYHPSNSRLFIYGDGPTEEYLKFLDGEYLSRFSRQAVDSAITFQRRFRKPRRKAVPYPVSKDESLEKKSFVVVGLKLGRSTDPEHCLGMEILSHILLGAAASPLRKALMDSELGAEVTGGGFDDNRAETLFAVGLKGTEVRHEEKILDLIFGALTDLAAKGIDPDVVKASVNTIDFKLREANFGGFPKGIVYNIQALGSWLYGADPLMHLKYERLMKKIQRRAGEGYFERLIQKHFLDNPHKSVIVLSPTPGLAERGAARLRKKLRQVKAGLTPEELQGLIEKTRTLQELQVAPDSPEALATLPGLELDDCSRESPTFPLDVKRETSPVVLYHDLFTNKIAYVQWCFNTEGVPQEQVQYLPLLGRMVLGMGTRKRDYVDFSKQVGMHTGGMVSSHFTTATVQDRHRILSYLNFSGTVLVEKCAHLFDLFAEVFLERSFHDHRRMVELIRSTKSNLESSIIPHGNQYVFSRLQAYGSRLGRYDEWTDGISYFRFMETLLARAEKDPAQVAAEFEAVARRVFSRENLLFNVTAEGKDEKKILQGAAGLMDALPGQAPSPAALEPPAPPVNEAFLTPSTVQYVGQGINLYDQGFAPTGMFDAVKAILRTGYLWDRVRVQGGAYGCSLSFDSYTGDLGVVSYRDPNLGETLEVYSGIPEFLAHLDITSGELEKIIIGAVGRLDPPLSPDRKGALSRVEYLDGLTPELKQKRREELFSTSLKDVRAFAWWFELFRDKGHVCVLGNETRIRKEGSRFDHLIPVFH
ncbi:MAG: insulinase family protein [Nitrospinaceae bacterium]